MVPFSRTTKSDQDESGSATQYFYSSDQETTEWEQHFSQQAATLIADIILPCLKYKKIGNDCHLVGQPGRQQQAGAAHHGQQQPNGYTNRKNSYTSNIKRSLESL